MYMFLFFMLLTGFLVGWILHLRSQLKWMTERANDFEMFYRHAEAERLRCEKRSWEQ